MLPSPRQYGSSPVRYPVVPAKKPRAPMRCAALVSLSLLMLVADRAGAAPQGDDPASWENQAAQACRFGDFDLLFEAFVFSPEVQRRYSAQIIEQRSFAAPHTILEERTDPLQDFAIGRVDHTYADPASIRRWEAGQTSTFTTLEVQHRLQTDGSMRIDYQSAIFRPEDEEGEAMVLVRKTGRPAAYVFEPVDGCWRLKQHLR